MSSDVSVRILIVNASSIARAGLAALLARHASLRIVGEARNGQEAVAQCCLLQPDIVLMEGCFSPLDSLEATRHICHHCPGANVILLSSWEAEEDIQPALRAGVKAFLFHDSTPESLFDAIRAVQAGESCAPPESAGRPGERASSGRLTEHELEVLRVLVTGKSNQQIGQTLCLAEGAVKIHVTNIVRKLKVRDRTQAAIIAVMQGIVRVP